MRPSNELEELLSSPPHLDDDGFTDRVMARLPVARGRVWRGVVLAVSTCAALAGAVLLPGARVAIAAARDLLVPLLALPLDPDRAGAALASMGSMGAPALAVHGVVLAVIVWGGVALARGEAR